MTPNQVAKIAIRTLSIFLVYRALEFGITQVIQGQYALGIMNQSVGTGDSVDPKISEAIRALRMMTAVGAIIPILLAGALWFVAPTLSRWVAGSDADSFHENGSLPLRATLLQVAAIVIIAMAATTLPKLVYEYQVDLRRDPSITLMTSKVFPDAIQFFTKVFVGGVMLLVVKKKLLGHPDQRAEHIVDGNGG
jgi:hypothetical protein